MRIMARAFLSALILAAILFDANSAEPESKQLCIYAPKPEYPPEARARNIGGSGMFALHLNRKTGIVKFVTVEKSTGSKLLDNAAIDCFKRWRFIRNIEAPMVKVPFTFTTTGIIEDIPSN